METKIINNSFYDELGEKWYDSIDHSIALLRAENRVRTPWVISKLPPGNHQILDVGCGAGFLSNALAVQRHRVTGIDLSKESLKVAKRKDKTSSVIYLEADAYSLPFDSHSFDVVSAMDFLEHIENPERAVSEISRVLKPGGLFFFHTFNRTLLSWLIVLKGVEWFVKDTPKDFHVFHLFLKPKELHQMCSRNFLVAAEWVGLSPSFWSKAFWKLLSTGLIMDNFTFRITKSLRCGYMGIARKEIRTKQ